MAAEDKPVLVLVDDIQWVDGDSAAAILFAARRLHDAQVAALLAVREPTPSAVELDGLDRLEVGPLDEAAARLVATGASDSVVEAAAGNPLALVELARHGSAGEGEGTVAELLFGARVDGLNEAARGALLAAALDTSGSADVVAAAAGGRKSLEELQRHHLVSVQAGSLELQRDHQSLGAPFVADGAAHLLLPVVGLERHKRICRSERAVPEVVKRCAV
jgi:hypothetical protein